MKFKRDNFFSFISRINCIVFTFLRTSPSARRIREVRERMKFSACSFDLLIKRMHELDINTVLDIGANVGQFGIDLRRHGFAGQIISFEPISSVATELEKTARRHTPWKVYNHAIGLKNEFKDINVANNSALSSSFLEMLSSHLLAFPTSFTRITEKVKIMTLDKVAENLEIQFEKTLIKIDVQGLEKDVIIGGQRTISKVPLCLLEASIKPLYKGEASILELLQELFLLGHNLCDIYRGISDSEGNLLQVDILTCKKWLK